MQFGRLAVICGLAIEAWMIVFTTAAGLQLLALSLIG